MATLVCQADPSVAGWIVLHYFKNNTIDWKYDLTVISALKTFGNWLLSLLNIKYQITFTKMKHWLNKINISVATRLRYRQPLFCLIPVTFDEFALSTFFWSRVILYEISIYRMESTHFAPSILGHGGSVLRFIDNYECAVSEFSKPNKMHEPKNSWKQSFDVASR